MSPDHRRPPAPADREPDPEARLPAGATGIRTFHDRRGRLGAGATAALHDLLPRYGLDPVGAPLDLGVLFGPSVPVVLEFGSGQGEAALALAQQQPQSGVIAVEVHTPGVSRLLSDVHRHGLTNVRVVHGDGVAFLGQRVPPAGLAGLRALFPDPWPKARHHKRRLVRPDLIGLIASRLAPGAWLQLATDWPDYAQQMHAVIAAEPLLQLQPAGRDPRAPARPTTRYGRKAHREGRSVVDIVAIRR